MKVFYVLRDFFMRVLDAIVPRKSRTVRAEALSPEDVPLRPTVHELLGKKVTTLMDYENPKVADLIHALKYDSSVRVARLCASALADYLHEEIVSHKLYSQKRVLLIPMPLHPRRKRERGFNQIGVVLDALPQEFKDGSLSRIAVGVLERARDTAQQTKLSRSERLSNVAGAFRITDPEIVKGAHVYLIDDVTTTGATLVHAANPLTHYGADVTLLALARA